MARLGTILSGVYDEISAVVVGIVPTREAQIRFARRDDDNEIARPLSEALGRARLFELGDDLTLERYEWIGGTTRSERYTFSLAIVYPLSFQWKVAAYEDADRIAANMLHTATSVTGCAMRVASKDEVPTIERVEDDPWFILRIPILVIAQPSGE